MHGTASRRRVFVGLHCLSARHNGAQESLFLLTVQLQTAFAGFQGFGYVPRQHCLKSLYP